MDTKKIKKITVQSAVIKEVRHQKELVFKKEKEIGDISYIKNFSHRFVFDIFTVGNFDRAIVKIDMEKLRFIDKNIAKILNCVLYGVSSGDTISSQRQKLSEAKFLELEINSYNLKQIQLVIRVDINAKPSDDIGHQIAEIMGHVDVETWKV